MRKHGDKPVCKTGDDLVFCFLPANVEFDFRNVFILRRIKTAHLNFVDFCYFKFTGWYVTEHIDCIRLWYELKFFTILSDDVDFERSTMVQLAIVTVHDGNLKEIYDMKITD